MKYKKQQGQVLVLALAVVGLVLANTLLVIGGSQIFYQNTNYTVQSSQAVNLAEAGVDKALASLNATGGSYSGEIETGLGDGSYSVSITTPGTNTKVIEVSGYIPSKANPKVKKTIQATVSKGIGAAFNYGVQVGEGGLEMENNTRVNGSIYSNGNIKMSNNAVITGDTFVAGGTAAASDQESDCDGVNCTDFVFGKNVSGNDRLDTAQSFEPSSSDYLNKISLKLKKTGSPSDVTVRILGDNNGKPNKNNVLASGTLPASMVTTQYSFVDVSFAASPQLSANATYWIVVDTSLNSSNYWSWSMDSLGGYINGAPMWSSNWQANNPVWTAINGDLGFKTYMGGVPTYIQGTSGSRIGGDAHANTLQNLIVTKGAYYQTATGVTAGSTYPNSPDPATKIMPISDANIQAWKDQAQELGVYTGNISSCRAQLGPGKYDGNVTFSNGCTITITDPLWITGDLNMSNNVTMKLDPSYGASSGVMIIDGKVTLSNNAKILGTTTAGSYLMALSTFDSRTNGIHAIDVSNGGNTGILCAPFGIAYVSNANHLNELTAWKIELENGVVIDYDTGLSSAFFSSGPSGAYSLVKGMYQIK